MQNLMPSFISVIKIASYFARVRMLFFIIAAYNIKEALTYRKLYVIIKLLKVQKTVLAKGGEIMLAVNYTNLRDNMKTYMDKVTDDYETLIVTRKDNRNIVMLSEEAYNNLMENIYVMGNKANYDWLMESKAQLESCKFSAHELVEVDDE